MSPIGSVGRAGGRRLATVGATDFSEYATGTPPNDWTRQWNPTADTFTVEADAAAEGGQLLELANPNEVRRVLSWDQIGTVEDVEVLALFRSTSTAGSQGGCATRVSGGSGTETGYSARIRSGAFSITRYDGGSFTAMGSAGTAAADTWYWLRFRTEGDTHQLRAWEKGTVEPDAWTVEAVDASITGDGAAGVDAYGGTNPILHWDYVSYGAGGATAPIL